MMPQYNRRGRQFVCSWDDVPVLIDVAMAARILGFTVEHTRRLLCKGKIPGHKMDKDWRINKEAFRAFVESPNNQ